MIQSLDSWLSLSTVVWLFPIAFMLHDLEEIIFVESFLHNQGDRVLARLPKRFIPTFQARANLRADQMAVAVGLVLLAVLTATLIGNQSIERGVASPMFVGTLGIFLGHVLTHTAQSVFLRAYTPGVVTCWLVVVPYSLYAFHRLIAAGLYAPSMLVWMIPMAVLVVALALVGHRLGMIVRKSA